MSFVELGDSTTLKGKNMTFPKQAELDTLGKNVSQGLSQDDLSKLIELTKEKNKWQSDQLKKITDIVALIKKDQVSLISLVDNQAYSKNELKLAAVRFGLIQVEKNGDTDQDNDSDGGIKRMQKTGPVVFIFEKTGGFRSSQIRQDSTLPATPNDSHIAFFLKSGKTKEKLLQLKDKTPENDSFLKSADGIKLVNEWVNWFETKVKNFVEKHPEKVPAKA
jgi:hypothetical protein